MVIFVSHVIHLFAMCKASLKLTSDQMTLRHQAYSKPADGDVHHLQDSEICLELA